MTGLPGTIQNKKNPPQGTLHVLAHARKIKKIYAEKISYASGNGNYKKDLLHFLKRKLFLYFRKQERRKTSLFFRKRNCS